MAVSAAMERGKGIAPPRLIVLAVAAIIGAVLLAGDVALTHQQVAGVTEASASGSGPALVFSGKIGNQSWQVVVRRYGRQPGAVCWFGHGPAFHFPTAQYENTAESCGKLHAPPATFGDTAAPGLRPDPVQFDDFSQYPVNAPWEAVQVALGVVGPSVTSIVLRLDDGQQLRLVPVQRYGYRLVAFVIPGLTEIARATAFRSDGQYATTTPSYLDGLTSFPSWQWHDGNRH